MAMVIILSYKAQNPLRANDYHTMETVIAKTNIHIYYNATPKTSQQQQTMTN
jgi:hypothetical protein